MRDVVVTEGQSLLDITLQVYGSTEGLIDLCKLNNLSINEPLVAGQKIVFDESKIRKPRIVEFFKKEFPRINTGRGKVPEGIGYWIIESEFIVS
jgi:hypothetical protein